MTKPPLGLTPQWLHKEVRLDDIREAIDRYKEAGKGIPEEWVVEATELAQWIANYFATKEWLGLHSSKDKI